MLSEAINIKVGKAVKLIRKKLVDLDAFEKELKVSFPRSEMTIAQYRAELKKIYERKQILVRLLNKTKSLAERK